MGYIFENEERLRKKAMSLPLSPGVYIMKDKKGKIIYIGKAKALKNRVSQYFGSHRAHGEKVIKMVSQVDDFEYIVCDSEYEALMLECSLIKRNQPKYNILLKDDKGYHYVRITKGEWPTISFAMQKEDDGAEYLGPYYSSYVVRQTVESARKIFLLPTCNKTLGNKKANGRPCLNYYIKNCSAPCCEKISKKEYNESVQNAVKFIKSGAKESIKELKAEMNKAAEELKFEQAAALRDKINAIDKMNIKQKVVSATYKEQDIVASAYDRNTVCFEVFVFRNGDLSDRREFVFDIVDEIDAVYTEFLTAYYMQYEIPKRITIDYIPKDSENLEKFLSESSGKSVKVVTAQKGNQQKLIDMCKNNAAEKLAQELGFKGNKLTVLEELKDLLGLKEIPHYIESYDISNTAGSENVAGMVTFLDGMPYKSGYKKFRIKSFIGQDDFRSMAEVIDRRLTEHENSDEEIGFGRKPDLILLDGGKGQLSAVLDIMKNHNIDIPVFGMVKDSKHKTRAITAGGGDIEIKANRRVYTLVSTIQEEVHRFSVSFHHSRTKNSKLTTELYKINGVGKVKAAALMKYFKSVSAIKNAELSEIEAVSGIDKKTALSIYKYFNEI